MAKVGRAAYNSSRKRIETISADKTISSAEAGELYLIDHNAASALTITLPAMQDGAYFKFVVKTKLAAEGTIVIKSSEATASDFAGGIVEQVLHAGDGAVSYQLAGAHHTLTLNDDINIGSNIECVSDGSAWYITGTVLVEAVGPNAVFS